MQDHDHETTGLTRRESLRKLGGVAALALGGAAGIEVLDPRDAAGAGAGLAAAFNAPLSGLAFVLEEMQRDFRPAVFGAAELLGIDPMHVANEGVLVAVVAPEQADAALAALREAGDGTAFGEAAIVGEVRADPAGMVLVETGFGGRRVMDQLVGDPLPRIC